MKQVEWSRPAPADVVARRAAGRRAYNAHRQFEARDRRHRVLALMERYSRGAARGVLTRGLKARIARELDVSRATIGRDWRAVWGELGAQTCRCCGYNRALGLRLCFHGSDHLGATPVP